MKDLNALNIFQTNTCLLPSKFAPFIFRSFYISLPLIFASPWVKLTTINFRLSDFDQYGCLELNFEKFQVDFC